MFLSDTNNRSKQKNHFLNQPQAAESTPSGRSSTSRLLIRVSAEDSNPPALMATSTSGRVEEGAAEGTKVKDEKGREIKFVVTDLDRVSEDGF